MDKEDLLGFFRDSANGKRPVRETTMTQDATTENSFKEFIDEKGTPYTSPSELFSEANILEYLIYRCTTSKHNTVSHDANTLERLFQTIHGSGISTDLSGKIRSIFRAR